MPPLSSRLGAPGCLQGFAPPLPTGKRGCTAGSPSRGLTCATFLGVHPARREQMSSLAPWDEGCGSGGTTGTAAQLAARRAAPAEPSSVGCRLGEALAWAQSLAGEGRKATSQQVTGFVVATAGQVAPGAAGMACRDRVQFPNPLQSLLSPASVPLPGFLLCLPGSFPSIQPAPVVGSHGIPQGRAPAPAALASRLRCTDLTDGVCTASAGFAPAPARAALLRCDPWQQ